MCKLGFQPYKHGAWHHIHGFLISRHGSLSVDFGTWVTETCISFIDFGFPHMEFGLPGKEPGTPCMESQHPRVAYDPYKYKNWHLMCGISIFKNGAWYTRMVLALEMWITSMKYSWTWLKPHITNKDIGILVIGIASPKHGNCTSNHHTCHIMYYSIPHKSHVEVLAPYVTTFGDRAFKGKFRLNELIRVRP